MVTVAVPLAVAGAMVGLLAWSAWPLVRPAREVAVVQAVFDRSSDVAPSPEIAGDGPARVVPTVQAPGWLEAEPFMIAAAALADGVVERIEVLEGDYVERGEVVARLIADDSELRLRRAAAGLADARADLATASAERAAAERSWDEPVELERAVETSRAALAESRAELAQLPSLIDSTRATLVRLEEDAARSRRSVERGAANEFELIVSEQRAAAQRAEVAALEARGPIIGARIDRLVAELRAAERNLELRIEDRRRLDSAVASELKAEARVALAEAVYAEAALELERMVVRAPISGYVQRRLKYPGDKVIQMMDSAHSAHLVHLYDPERIQVRVDVPLADASFVSVGQPCEVVVEVLPDRVFRGEVLRITHEADLQKNTLQMKVKVIDPDPVLRPEMLTRVKFLPPGGSADGSGGGGLPGVEGEARRVLVPSGALDGAGGSSRLWLVGDRRNGRGVLSSRGVRAVDLGDGWSAVTGDLRPGDLIAVGVEAPREGERVVVSRDAWSGAPVDAGEEQP